MPYSPWVTKRRNVVRNPQFKAGLNNWIQSSITASVSTEWRAGAAVRLTSQGGTNGDIRFNGGNASTFPLGIEKGKTYLIQALINKMAVDGTNNRSRRILAFVSTNGSTYTEMFGPQGPNVVGEQVLTHTLTIPSNATGVILGVGSASSTSGVQTFLTDVIVEEVPGGAFFTGSSIPADPKLEQYAWEGVVNNSASIYQTRTYTPAVPVIPVKDLTTEDVLYNDRVTSYRWEVLEHSNGVDQLIGILDGVSNANLSWTQNVAVKGSGKLEVLDLDSAQAGMLRVADLKLESVRVRPVCSIEGLPENPLGVFLVSAAKEEWEDTGRVWSMELLDKCTVPSQDVFDQSYAVAAGTLILQQVRLILASCNEYIAINSSSTLATSSGMVWEAGTSKLKIINDLLDVAGYNALWMDGYGNFQATPRVLPADRSILYEVLGIPRELVDGEQAIYRPSWQRDRDSFEVPNKVIAVQAAGGADDAALIGTWTNEDPNSPYSYQSRGRWIPHVLDSVECPDGTDAEIVAFLQKRAQTTLVQMSAVQAQVSIEHLPIPARVSDVVRFAHTKAGVDSRHVITKMQLDANPLGTMKTTLQEVITL